jgi:ABC-type lipoprotein export system ATPase subunit
MSEATLSFRRVSKFYSRGDGGGRFALRDVSFEVPQGRAVAITGRSGSGVLET